jgi:hypothetical protein
MVDAVDDLAAGSSVVVGVLRVTPFAAWRDGVRRVLRAPAIFAGVWIGTVLVTLPLVVGVRAMLEQHLGSSLEADAAASGVNYDWMQAFGDQAAGVGVTFKPTIIGFGAVLDNLSGFVDNVRRPVVILGAAAAYIVLWTFAAGGIIDRYARDRAIRSHGFFAASGVFFFRFARLAAMIAVVYGFLFGYVHPWLFDRVYSRVVYEVSAERTAFFVRVVFYVAFGVALAMCNLIFDYAKVRAVVEDRRSMVGAVAAALGFIRRNAAAVIALYVVDFALFLGAIAVYSVIVPAVGRAGWMTWIAFAVGQLYILARLIVKLVFWASETALFQGRLAHAGYVANPPAAWPESPAAEDVGRPSSQA